MLAKDNNRQIDKLIWCKEGNFKLNVDEMSLLGDALKIRTDENEPTRVEEGILEIISNSSLSKICDKIISLLAEWSKKKMFPSIFLR